MNRNFGSEAIYSCVTGFEIIGMGSRFCLANGAWNGSAPTCQSESKNTAEYLYFRHQQDTCYLTGHCVIFNYDRGVLISREGFH